LCEQLPRGAWLEIELLTGRKHQIRVQLASRGHPILGDRKYGARSQFAAGIALHARRLVVSHPVQKETIELIAPLPPSWRVLGASDQ
jgi:23S rRNA pseudouridine1911/1915/1917 synthase